MHFRWNKDETALCDVKIASSPLANSAGGFGSSPGTAQDQVYPQGVAKRPRVAAGIVFHF
jgi:hypothetical protein